MAATGSDIREVIARKLSACWGLRHFPLLRRFPVTAEARLSGFRTDRPPTRQAYAELFHYFMAGHATHRSRLGALADYPGMGSYNGPAMDRLEGFSRIAPLAGAWLYGNRPARITLDDGKSLDLLDLLKAGILAGTDPASKEYWGNIQHWGQAIVEAADLALTLWLTRHRLWNSLSAEQRSQVANWLIQVNGKRIPDNNWHLFVVQVNAVLSALGEAHDAAGLESHYQRAKTFYRGDGWFQDGDRADTPGFDYYNAWGFHYQLQWINRIQPKLDPDFITTAFMDFVASYRYFIGPQGFPVMGRSACYRMAAPAPLIFAQADFPDRVKPGEARRALDVTWQYFIRRGAVAHGNVKQGYLEADPRLLENYSGPASCLWSLRSLVAAFALSDDHPFWTCRPELLPVEKADFSIPVGPTGWTVVGSHATHAIALLTGHGNNQPLQDHTAFDRLAGMLTGNPRRPANTLAKYYRSCYDSATPYGMTAVSADPPPPTTPDQHIDAAP